MLRTYEDQIRSLAKRRRVKLEDAFKEAGCHRSMAWRHVAKAEHRVLSYQLAARLAAAIERLAKARTDVA